MVVTRQYGKLNKVLICKPTYFSLQPVNETAKEFLERGDPPDMERAQWEHAEFATGFKEVGVEILEIPPEEGFPYQVFTRDSGVTTSQGMLLGSFRESIRQGEEQFAAEFLEGQLPVWDKIVGDGMVFEGGDFMYIDENRAAPGVALRTTWETANYLQDRLKAIGIELIPVPFDPKYCHLDMVFNVVADKVCVLCPEILPEDFLIRVSSMGFDMIPIAPSQVLDLDGNLISVDDAKVVSPVEIAGSTKPYEPWESMSSRWTCKSCSRVVAVHTA